MNVILGGTHGLGAELAAYLKDKSEANFVIGRSYSEHMHGYGYCCDLADRSNITGLLTYLQPIVAEQDTLNLYWCASIGYVGDFSDQLNTLCPAA